MPEDMKVGCARPTGGPVGEDCLRKDIQESVTDSKEVSSMIHVGKKVPDFAAPGYHQGKFISTNLSEYLGKWVLICFYPGDFTFV